MQGVDGRLTDRLGKFRLQSPVLRSRLRSDGWQANAAPLTVLKAMNPQALNSVKGTQPIAVWISG
jgi:hypothetical protein